MLFRSVNESVFTIVQESNLSEGIEFKYQSTTILFQSKVLVNAPVTTGISESKLKGLSFFYNPISNLLTVNATGIIQLVNMQGKLVLTEMSHGTSTNLNISHLPAGVYLLGIKGYVAAKLSLIKNN